MNYIEFLRMRRNLAWYAGPLTALALFAVVSVNMNVHAAGAHSDLRDGLDMAVLFAFPLGTALIFATIIGGTLSRENETPEMIRTKPFSLELIAASYLLTGLAAILVAFVIACVLVYLVGLDLALAVGVGPVPLHFTEQSAVLLALGLGVAFMWYALVQAVAAGLKGRGGTVVGLSWATFTILVALSHATFLPPAVHDLIMLLNVLNPLAYMNSLTTHGDATSVLKPNSIFALDAWVRAGIVWAIALIASGVAIFNWKRLEF
jgi:hypothetical protein